MSIPHYRCVRGTDDGCAIYQCLLCGGTWEWRGGSAKVRYCMFCGGTYAYENKLDCREQDTPRWLYDLKARVGDAYYRFESRWWHSQETQKPIWVIQKRCIWLKKDGTDDYIQKDWTVHNRLRSYGHEITAHDARRELLRLRLEEANRDTPDDPDYDPEIDNPPWFRYEFRLIREKP